MQRSKKKIDVLIYSVSYNRYSKALKPFSQLKELKHEHSFFL